MQSRISENVQIWLNFKGPHHVACDMRLETQARLERAGRDLRANHDEAIIADLIHEIEASDSPTSEITGNILRTMMGDADNERSDEAAE